MYVKQATAITLWGSDPLPRGMRVEFDHGVRWRDGRQGRCLLVSWWREPRADRV